MKRISEVLGEALPDPELLRLAKARRAMRRWSEAVGEVLAGRVWPDRFERGTLFLLASGSAWAQEVSLRRDTILRRMNEIAGESMLFKELRVAVGDPTRGFGAPESEPDAE